MTTRTSGPPAVAGVAEGRPVGPLAVLGPDPRAVASAASVAAAVLAASSTGPVVVAAVLVGVGAFDRRSGAAVLLAAIAVSVRFGTATFDDLAGIQSVLGPAGVVGPEVAAASAWCAAAAVVLACRVPGVPGGAHLPWRLAPPLASGVVAAALVAGPGADQLVLRVAASVAGVVLATALTLGDRWPAVLHARLVLALVAGGAAVALAGWPT